MHRKLPPSFDLDELVAVGNLALTRAALDYRPEKHGGAPFSAYARAAIAGAIKDSFRGNKFAEQTRPPMDNVIEFPKPSGSLAEINERIDLTRRIAQLRSLVTRCLTPRQAAVVDAYYSPAMPDLPAVAKMLGLTRDQAYKAHSQAIQTLKARLAEVA
jgi:RNA polymerase sigma factor (sigma-70 family)